MRGADRKATARIYISKLRAKRTHDAAVMGLLACRTQKESDSSLHGWFHGRRAMHFRHHVAHIRQAGPSLVQHTRADQGMVYLLGAAAGVSCTCSCRLAGSLRQGACQQSTRQMEI
eukprot:1715135-Pyramimonas_sp.AAC.1